MGLPASNRSPQVSTVGKSCPHPCLSSPPPTALIDNTLLSPSPTPRLREKKFPPPKNPQVHHHHISHFTNHTPTMPKQKAPKGNASSSTSSNTAAAKSDPRFASLSADPRFRLPSKKHSHVKLDKRLSRI